MVEKVSEMGYRAHGESPMRKYFVLLACIAVSMATSVWAKTIEVGPGRRQQRIDQANKIARAGDLILVYPQAGNAPYTQEAIFVRVKNLTFRAVPAKGEKWVKISGKGYDYSGRGSTPRAIFQFNKGTDNCLVEGFELFDAHNGSHNGAGVRINQANNVTLRNCNIHKNDMGIMSNSDGTQQTGVNQRIEHCLIHHNGSFEEPGYNHNLYLGGTSVTLSFCEVHGSLTGHNVKSRAHYTRVQYSYIHDSANREFDLVDGKDTERPNSHAVLLGNIIVKDSNCKGNRAVIHYGQDGGKEHDGTIYLYHNTIVTPFVSPVLDLSASKAKAHLIANFISDGGKKQNGQKLLSARNNANIKNVTGTHNWFDRGFAAPAGAGLSAKDNSFGKHIAAPFADPAKHDYRLVKKLPVSTAAREQKLPPIPGAETPEKDLGWIYVHPAGKAQRKESKYTLGAYPVGK